MNSDITELVRDGLDRLTDGARVPDGLASRAERHYRSRQRKLRAGAAVASGTAVVAVASVLVAALGAAPARPAAGHEPRILTVAYVTGRVERAIAAATAANRVEQVSVGGNGVSFPFFTPGSASGPGSYFYTPRARFWYYRRQFRVQGLTGAGVPRADIWTQAATGGSPEDLNGFGLDYRAKTWWPQGVSLPPAQKADTKCDGSLSVGGLLAVPGNWAAGIRAALRCGAYNVGRQRVDGVNAIRLTAVRPGNDVGFRQTLWVDSSTYLPVRVRWTWPRDSGRPGRMVADFTWQKPTAANRALLRAVVPSGYQKVTLTSQAPDLGILMKDR